MWFFSNRFASYHGMLYCSCATAAEEPVAMDTDSIHAAVKEESDLTAQSSTSTVTMSCTAPDASVCLLAPESGMQKDSLEDVGLDLPEPFALGNVYYLRDNYFCTLLRFREKFAQKKLAVCAKKKNCQYNSFAMQVHH